MNEGKQNEFSRHDEIEKEAPGQVGNEEMLPEVERQPEDDLPDFKTQAEEFKDKYLRAHAEMDNMKKRMERDRKDIIKYGTERLLRDLLLVYDAIEKSIAMALEMHPDDEDFIKGLRMTEKLFLETLKKNSVEPIETENMPFDPNYHEAMMQVTRPDIVKGMVVNEIEKGFLLHDRVLRPSKVTVSG
ncbi:MAG TPA: nucleotide exchange factor GrpE [Deltaproteobacteria bacterium]|nr:nucleotide exchange factor GrpE [Deltaproteobacteria bacterium]